MTGKKSPGFDHHADQARAEAPELLEKARSFALVVIREDGTIKESVVTAQAVDALALMTILPNMTIKLGLGIGGPTEVHRSGPQE